MGVRPELRERGLHEPPVLPDQLALHSPHARVAEEVERACRGAAFIAQSARNAGREPRAEPDLLLEAERAKDRRVQVPVRPHRAAPLRLDLGAHGGVEMQPRHLVLVLVGHQLVEGARHRLGHARPPRRALRLLARHAARRTPRTAARRRGSGSDQLGDADLEQPPQLAGARRRSRRAARSSAASDGASTTLPRGALRPPLPRAAGPPPPCAPSGRRGGSSRRRRR